MSVVILCSPTSAANQKLDATVSVSKLFGLHGKSHIIANFELENKGDTLINPNVYDTLIVIDGTPLKDSPYILRSAPPNELYSALPAGQKLQFTHKLEN